MPRAKSVTVACNCPKCVHLCNVHPGWMYPSEAKKIIDSGMHDRLMLDFRYKEAGRDYDIPVLSPAVYDRKGNYRGGRLAPQIWERVKPEDQIDPKTSNMIELVIGMLGILKAQMEEEGFITGTCTFLLADNKCDLHGRGLKPIECRTGYGCGKGTAVSRIDIAKTWDTPEGREIVALWRKLTGCDAMPFTFTAKERTNVDK